jgi:hypothetical protein
MLISCINSTYKIYGIKQEADENETQDFLSNYFIDESQVTVLQLVKWCAKVPEIAEFVDLIERDPVNPKRHEDVNVIPISDDDEEDDEEVE